MYFSAVIKISIRLTLLYVIALLSSCDLSNTDSSDSAKSSNGIYDLDALAEYWREQAMLCEVPGMGISFPTKQTGKVEQPCDDGDMTLFNGLLCAAGNNSGCEGVKFAQDQVTGEWFRSPRIQALPVDPSRGVRNDRGDHEFSPDMAIGVQLYLLKTKDIAGAEKWFSWLHSLTCEPGSTNCTNPPMFCGQENCGIRPGDAAVLGRTAQNLIDNHGMQPLPPGSLKNMMDNESVRFENYILAQSIINRPGYSQHLVAAQILISNMLGVTDDKVSQAAIYLDKNPVNEKNAFMAYLLHGDTPQVRDHILSRCPTPKTRLKSPLKQWTWEREVSDRAWESSCYWDCLFAYELLTTGLSTPAGTSPQQCIVSGPITDDRDVLYPAPNEVFENPFLIRDRKDKSKVRFMYRNYTSGEPQYFDFDALTQSGDRETLRVLPKKDPLKWEAAVVRECQGSGPLCSNGDYVTAITDKGNGLYSVSDNIYSVKGGVASQLTSSPVVGDLKQINQFAFNGKQYPVVFWKPDGRLNRYYRWLSFFDGSRWEGKRFGELCSVGARMIVFNSQILVNCIWSNHSDVYVSNDLLVWKKKDIASNPMKHITAIYSMAYRPQLESFKPLSSSEVFVMGFYMEPGKPGEKRAFLIEEGAGEAFKVTRVLNGDADFGFGMVWIDSEHIIYSAKNDLVTAHVDSGNVIHRTQVNSTCFEIFRIQGSSTIYAFCDPNSGGLELDSSIGLSDDKVIFMSGDDGVTWKNVTQEVGLF